MKKWVLRIITTVIVLAVAVFIFAMSAQPSDESSQTSHAAARIILSLFPSYNGATEEAKAEMVEYWNPIFRTAGHFTEYFIFGIALFFMWKSWNVRYSGLFAMATGSLYAFTDEIHQKFVPGRVGDIYDVVTDSLGCYLAVGILVLIFFLVYRKHRKRKKY